MDPSRSIQEKTAATATTDPVVAPDETTTTATTQNDHEYNSNTLLVSENGMGKAADDEETAVPVVVVVSTPKAEPTDLEAAATDDDDGDDRPYKVYCHACCGNRGCNSRRATITLGIIGLVLALSGFLITHNIDFDFDDGTSASTSASTFLGIMVLCNILGLCGVRLFNQWLVLVLVLADLVVIGFVVSAQIIAGDGSAVVASLGCFLFLGMRLAAAIAFVRELRTGAMAVESYEEDGGC